jgi:hypothetical protein
MVMVKNEGNSERTCLSALNKTLTLKTPNYDFGFFASGRGGKRRYNQNTEERASQEDMTAGNMIVGGRLGSTGPIHGTPAVLSHMLIKEEATPESASTGLIFTTN